MAGNDGSELLIFVVRAAPSHDLMPKPSGERRARKPREYLPHQHSWGSLRRRPRDVAGSGLPNIYMRVSLLAQLPADVAGVPLKSGDVENTILDGPLAVGS